MREETINVKVTSNADEVQKKLDLLSTKIKEAKTLANELASIDFKIESH